MSDLRAANVVAKSKLLVGATSVGLDSATPYPLVNGTMNGHMVRRALITCLGNDVAWTMDGSAAIAGSCHVLEADGTLSLTGANWRGPIKDLQFIQITAAATIIITAMD